MPLLENMIITIKKESINVWDVGLIYTVLKINIIQDVDGDDDSNID